MFLEKNFLDLWWHAFKKKGESSAEELFILYVLEKEAWMRHNRQDGWLVKIIRTISRTSSVGCKSEEVDREVECAVA